MRTQLLSVTIVSLLAMCTETQAFSPGQRLAFVTSVQGTGNLNSWPDSGGNSGLAAADAICVNRAKAAQLPEPEQFVAWMSDNSDDAYCRIHGLNGKRSAKCGQLVLPVAAGPWWRTDGQLFADQIGAALHPQGRIYRILNIDEFGQPVALFDQFELPIAAFTNTNKFGEAYSTDNCGNWTSQQNSDSTNGGQLIATSTGWTNGTSGIKCSIPTPIYCLQRGTGDAVLGGKHRGRPAFITIDTYSGNLGNSPRANGQSGVQAADAICQFEATFYGKLPRSETFRAWISAPGQPARNRFTNDGPWYRIDGVKFASSLSQLSSSGAEQPLNVSTSIDADYFTSLVWTGTDANGSAAPETCNGWNSDSGFAGRSGFANAAKRRWSDSEGLPTQCFISNRLYCLADNDTIFADNMDPYSN